VKAVLCAFVLGAALAQAQTAPAARDLGAVAHEVLGAIQSVRNHTGSLLRELEKKQPDQKTVQSLASEAVAQTRQIRKLIEELDAFYNSMPEDQQSALRRSWSVATILNGCMEAALDSLAEPSADVWSEVRTGIECAERRSRQLEEVLAPFRQPGQRPSAR